MQHSHLLPSSSGSPLPERFLSRLAGFTDLFTRPTWSNVLVLLAGAILAPGRRTVTTALRILGRECDPDFCTFHRILNRAAWSSRAVARQLLILLVKAFVPSGAPVVIGLDDTIERRWGEDQRPRHLSRSGPLVQRSLRQSQWPALAFRHVVGEGSVGRSRHGVAFSHSARPLQTLLCRQDPSTQNAARLGAPSRPANPPLAPRSLYRPGRRQRVCSHRIPRRSPQPCLCRHPPTPRCQLVRLPSAKTQRSGGPRHLVPGRRAASADPLASRSRSDRRA